MSYRTEGEFPSVRGGQGLSKRRWGLEGDGWRPRTRGWGLGRASKALGYGGGWLESGGDGMDVCLDVLTDGWKEISPVFWVRCPKGNSLG